MSPWRMGWGVWRAVRSVIFLDFSGFYPDLRCFKALFWPKLDFVAVLHLCVAPRTAAAAGIPPRAAATSAWILSPGDHSPPITIHVCVLSVSPWQCLLSIARVCMLRIRRFFQEGSMSPWRMGWGVCKIHVNKRNNLHRCHPRTKLERF